MDKLAKAETEFELENKNVDKLVKEIHTLANTILNELTIRFTVQVQLEFYEQMDKVFSKVKDLETKMNDLAYQQEQSVVSQHSTSQRIIQDADQRNAPYQFQS